MEEFKEKASKPSDLQINKADMLGANYGYHEYRADKSEHGFSVITFAKPVRAKFNKE